MAKRKTTKRRAPRRPKKARNNGQHWGSMLFGLAIGLGLAALLWVASGRIQAPAPTPATSAPAEPAPATPLAPTKKPPTPQALEATGEGFDFYQMLRDNEVVVTDAFQAPKTTTKRQAVDDPGTYTIQAGSFRQLEDAERLQALLALKNMQPRIEAVRIDDSFYHRVRIGPVADLERLNRYLADLDAEGYKFILLKDDQRQ